MAFHIHVPKPLHGWKAFFNEISVIVIGVLIALGLEAVVEELHWRHKVAEGRERLRLELRAQFGFVAELAIVGPCVIAQLDRIRDHLGPAGAHQPPLAVDRFPDNDAVLRLPTRPWSHNTWEALQHDGTSGHFPVDEQRYLGGLYSQIDTEATRTAQSLGAAAQLLAASYPGLSDAARSQLLLTVADQYGRTQGMTRVAAQIMATARDLGYAPEQATVNELISRGTYASNTIGFCKSHGLPLADWKAAMDKVPPLSKRAF